jgi:hypothetical protein
MEDLRYYYILTFELKIKTISIQMLSNFVDI